MTEAEALVAALDDAGYRLTEPRRAVAGLVVITCRAQPSAVHSLARNAADAVALNPASSASG